MSNVVKSVGNAISGAVKGVVNAVSNVVKGVVNAVGKVVSSVLNFITSPFMGAFGDMGAVPDAAQAAAAQEGVLITQIGGGTVRVPVVYGLRQVGGTVVYVETGADNNKYLWVAYALSEGPIEGIYDIHINDEDVTTSNLISKLNSGHALSVDKTGSRYAGKSVFQLWKGTYSTSPNTLQTANIDFLMTQAPGWKRSNVMNGLAVLMARYEWKKATTQEEADNNPFSGNIPTVKVTVFGRKVASLMPGSGAESVDWNGAGYSERWSMNPAEVLLDYLRSPTYGKGLKNNEIDWTSFRKAALKFNQEVTYVSGVKGPILTCNYVLDTGMTIMSNVKTLLQGMRAYMPYVQGKYKLKIEDAGNENDILSGVATIVATFGPENIVGDITYGGVDRSAKYTQVEVTYVSPTDKWANQSIVYPISEADRLFYQQEDGGRENTGTFTFPTLINFAMAYDMARLLFNKSRIQQTASFTASMQAMEIEPGDNIYINGNILDFVNEQNPELNVPWRVVSIKLNDNYTYQIDCVRNPDWIYPHARAFEKDIVLPPFIPKGAYIYYPGVYTDLGLQPPGTSYWADNELSGDQEPGTEAGGLPATQPTNPTDPTQGGGVGSPTNPGSSPAPVETAPPPPLTDYITIDNVTYTVVGSLVNATISFKQPKHPQYEGVDFWYKRNISTEVNYRTDRSTQRPGAGQTITHTFTNLIKSNIPYMLVNRVRYTTGDSSSFATRTPLNVSGAISSENPQDYPETAGAGWFLPTGTTSNPRNTTFNKIVGLPSLDAELNRKLTITVNQDINSTGFNDQVDGINIYYRLSGTTYWYKNTTQFDASYFPAVDYSFTPNLDLGIGNPSPDDASDNFDFIFRFKYKDGTESTKQWRYMGADVSNTSQYDPFYAVQKVFEDASAYSILTIDQAPPGTVTDTRAITIGILLTGYSYSGNKIVWNIQPPAVADRTNWYGVRVRSRKIPISGGSAPFEITDYIPVSQPNTGVWQISHPTEYNVDYEYVLTPLVRYAGAKTEANKSWTGRGSLSNTISTDQTTALNFKTIDSSLIEGMNNTPFPTPLPRAIIKGWKRVATVTGSSSPNANYFELEFSVAHISNINNIKIYRRSTNGGTSKGRWEYVTVETGVNAYDTGTSLVVNLRMPVDYSEFKADNTINTSYAWATKKVLTSQYQYADYLIVVNQGSTINTGGMLLPRIAYNTFINTNGAGGVPLSIYEGDVVYRNLSEAVTSYADSSLNTAVTATALYSRPTPLRGNNVV